MKNLSYILTQLLPINISKSSLKNNVKKEKLLKRKERKKYYKKLINLIKSKIKKAAINGKQSYEIFINGSNYNKLGNNSKDILVAIKYIKKYTDLDIYITYYDNPKTAIPWFKHITIKW